MIIFLLTLSPGVIYYEINKLYAVFIPILYHSVARGTNLELFSHSTIISSSAETSTPPLLDTSMSSESDFFICQTRTCIQPSHYFPATSQDGSTTEQNATCYYGAKKCPSRVARAKKMQASTSHCHHESEKEDSPSVEDVQLLRTERQGCCKKKQEPPPEETCCKKETTVIVHEPSQGCCKNEGREEQRQELREQSPQITCCHSASAPTDSQEQIIK